MYPYPNYQISRNWLKESNDQKWLQKEPTTGSLNPKWGKNTEALFRVLPMVPLVISPMVPLVANGTIGFPMVPLGEPMVPLALQLEPMVLPMVPLVEL